MSSIMEKKIHLEWNKRYIQAENEGLEKDISYKWKLKESRGSYPYIRQNKL